MDINEREIGKNIRSARKEKGLSQDKLAARCGISSTTLSLYENSKKTPNLITTAKIASGLNVSIDRLCYGDENSSFINQAPDEGRKIVNSIYLLWKQGVIYQDVNFQGVYSDYKQESMKVKMYNLLIIKHAEPIRRLINWLNEYQKKEATYDDPEGYLEMLLASVAKEINMEIEEEKLRERQQAAIRGDISHLKGK